MVTPTGFRPHLKQKLKSAGDYKEGSTDSGLSVTTARVLL